MFFILDDLIKVLRLRIDELQDRDGTGKTAGQGLRTAASGVSQRLNLQVLRRQQA
jgi:hypothetical protein